MPNKTPSDVIRSFALKTEREKQRREEGLMRNERYAELKKQCAALTIEYLSEKNEDKQNEILSLLKRAEKETSSMKDKAFSFVCPKCKGCGIWNKKPCDCVLPDIYEQCFGAENIEGMSECFAAFDIHIFDDDKSILAGKSQRELFRIIEKKVRAYANDFPLSAPKNMLFSGAAGLGKTFICRCIAKEVSKKAPVMYITAPQLARMFLAHRLGEDIELKYLHDAPLMIIDDLGTETMHQGVTIEYLTELIEKRQSALRHTVISTNLPLSSVQERYGERLASRLCDRSSYAVFTFMGNDVRRKKRKA